MEFRILIVDDDENLLSVLQNAFPEEKYRVSTSSNGLDAIQACREQSFDLVITDIMMPGATGMEVLDEVKKINPETLVVLITGFASLETAVNAIRQGAYDYITKPFRLEEIRIVVENALEKIGLVRENKKLLQELKKAYEQLQIVKEIMDLDSGIDNKKKSGGYAGIQKKTLIAGNTLPQHFLEDKDRSLNPSAAAISDLERVSMLKTEGLITSEEFELCKSKIFQNLK